MSAMDAFFAYSLFLGGALCFVIIIRTFASQTIQQRTWFDCLAFFAGGIFFLYTWLNFRGVYFSPGILNHLYLPCAYLVGPVAYISFFLMVDPLFRLKRWHAGFFIPPVLILIVLPLAAVLRPGVFAHSPTDYFRGHPATFLEIIFLCGFAYSGCYFLPILRRTSLLLNFHALKTQRSARILVGVYIVTLGLLALFGTALYLCSSFWFYLTAAVSAYLVVGIHIFQGNSPELFEQLQAAIEKTRISRLEGIDLKELHFELIELMTSEKLYMDENLTLAKLAEELDIKPHQLSEFLNKHMKMNFNRFINHMRIEKAVKLLLENPDANILDVAFECGFNSKTAFNAAFSNIKGLPPGRYIANKREEMALQSPES